MKKEKQEEMKRLEKMKTKSGVWPTICGIFLYDVNGCLQTQTKKAAKKRVFISIVSWALFVYDLLWFHYCPYPYSILHIECMSLAICNTYMYVYAKQALLYYVVLRISLSHISVSPASIRQWWFPNTQHSTRIRSILWNFCCSIK